MATRLLFGHQCLLLDMFVLLLPFIAGSKYLLPAKKSKFLTLILHMQKGINTKLNDLRIIIYLRKNEILVVMSLKNWWSLAYAECCMPCWDTNDVRDLLP